MLYPHATQEILREARLADRLGEHTTKGQRVLLALADGRWHPTPELADRHVGGHRFGGYVHDLREQGVLIATIAHPEPPKGERWYLYRLKTAREDEAQALLFPDVAE